MVTLNLIVVEISRSYRKKCLLLSCICTSNQFDVLAAALTTIFWSWYLSICSIVANVHALRILFVLLILLHKGVIIFYCSLWYSLFGSACSTSVTLITLRHVACYFTEQILSFLAVPWFMYFHAQGIFSVNTCLFQEACLPSLSSPSHCDV